MSAPVHVYKAYIGAGLDEVWRGITDGELTSQYRGPCHPDLGMAEFGTGVRSDWTPGASVEHVTRDGEVVADGKVIAIDVGAEPRAGGQDVDAQEGVTHRRGLSWIDGSAP